MVKPSATKDLDGEPFFDPDDLAYYVLPEDVSDGAVITPIDMTLRTQEHNTGIQDQLNLLSSKCGFGENHYRFDQGSIGYVDGLEGANCRHIRMAFVDGVMERTYTDEELAHIDDGHDVDFEGKHYTAYEATQKQRQVERTARKLKREQTAYKSAGLTEDYQAVTARIRRLNAEYKAFSEAAGLPLQRERMKVTYTDVASEKMASALKIQRDAEAPIRQEIQSGGKG